MERDDERRLGRARVGKRAQPRDERRRHVHAARGGNLCAHARGRGARGDAVQAEPDLRAEPDEQAHDAEPADDEAESVPPHPAQEVRAAAGGMDAFEDAHRVPHARFWSVAIA